MAVSYSQAWPTLPAPPLRSAASTSATSAGSTAAFTVVAAQIAPVARPHLRAAKSQIDWLEPCPFTIKICVHPCRATEIAACERYASVVSMSIAITHRKPDGKPDSGCRHDRLAHDAGVDAELIPELEFDYTLGW